MNATLRRHEGADRGRTGDRRHGSHRATGTAAEMEVRLVASGTVRWFNRESGYGYIAPDAGGKDLFVHRGSIMGDRLKRTLLEGARVGFDLRERSMSPEAIHVLPIGLERESMTGSALATGPSEFRCARCGYGICVSGALPACPMCQTTTWEPSAYTTRGAERSRTTEPRQDDGVAAKRAPTELTASVAVPLVRQTSGWKQLVGGRRKVPTARA
jgi:cold shock protein